MILFWSELAQKPHTIIVPAHTVQKPGVPKQAIDRIGYDALYIGIHAMRGDGQKAVYALRNAKDFGLPMDSWRLRLPYYDFMLEVLDWNSLMEELEADIARQREWYEEHKVEPLF